MKLSEIVSELEETLSVLNAQKLVLERRAEFEGFSSVAEMRYPNGTYAITEIIVAKARILTTLADIQY